MWNQFQQQCTKSTAASPSNSAQRPSPNPSAWLEDSGETGGPTPQVCSSPPGVTEESRTRIGKSEMVQWGADTTRNTRACKIHGRSTLVHNASQTSNRKLTLNSKDQFLKEHSSSLNKTKNKSCTMAVSQWYAIIDLRFFEPLARQRWRHVLTIWFIVIKIRTSGPARLWCNTLVIKISDQQNKQSC